MPQTSTETKTPAQILLQVALDAPPEAALGHTLDFLAAQWLGQPELFEMGPPGLAERVLAALSLISRGVDPDALRLLWLEHVETTIGRSGLTKAGIRVRSDVDALACAAALANTPLADFEAGPESGSKPETACVVTRDGVVLGTLGNQPRVMRALLKQGLDQNDTSAAVYAAALWRLQRYWLKHGAMFLVSDRVSIDIAFARAGIVLRRFAGARIDQAGQFEESQPAG